MQPVFRDSSLLTWIASFLLEHPHAHLYVVGGAVRDALRGKPIGDIDLVIGGCPAERIETWLAAHGTVSFVGKRFGVWKFSPHHDPKNPVIDIALPRKDVSIGESGGYRQFFVESDPALPIEEDLARRDFTINAIAYDWRRDELIDPFGGQTDLKAQLIRTVGNPAERFREDSSRLLRAIRFACTLGFSIEPGTWSVLKQMVPRLSLEMNGPAQPDGRSGKHRVVARELMAEEFMKTLEANPARCLELYQASSVWGAFLASSPAIGEVPEGRRGIRKVFFCYHPFYSPPKAGGEAKLQRELLLAILCDGVFESVGDAYDWLHLWRFEMYADVKAVVEVVRALKTDPEKVSLAQIERQLLPHRELLASALLATEQGDAKVWLEKLLIVHKMHDLPPLLTTDDLKNIPDGPKRGEIVNAVRSAQLAGEIATKKEALEYLASSPNLGEVPQRGGGV